MKAHSMELREKVAAAYLGGEGSLREIEERFCVSREFVRRMVALYEQTGSVQAAPHGGGRSKLGPDGEGTLIALVNAQPDATLAELRARLRRERKVSMSISGLHRALDRLGMSYKKSRSGLRSRTVPTSRHVGAPFHEQFGGTN